MSERETPDWYAYQGALGEVVRYGPTFSASKDGFLVGTYNTFEEAMESLVWRERLKTLLGTIGRF